MKHFEIVGIFVGCAIFAGILMYLGFKKYYYFKRRRRAFYELYQNLGIKEVKELEIFWIDLQRMKITSNKYFDCFQLHSHNKTIKINKLSALTGFDFYSHYKDIISKRKEEFKIEYDLYVEGEKLHFIERGAFVGCYLVTVVRVRLTK